MATRPTAQLVGIAFVALALCALMVLHAPGHLSYDSLVQLDEGFNRKYYSWNPPSFSLFLGATYALFGSTAAALLISQALLLVATYRLGSAPSTPVALRLCAFVSVLAVPIVVIYAGILWKDVFFAHLALMGFAVLQRNEVKSRHLFVTALLLGAAATIRQQGLVLLVPLLGYALWIARIGAGGRTTARWRLTLVALSGFFAGYVLINTIVKTTAVELPGKPYETATHLIQYYDIAGMAYREPEIPLDDFAASPDFDRDRFLRLVRRGYDPERIDYLESAEKSFTPPFKLGPEADRLVGRQWLSLVIQSPLTYLAHRADVFSWMLGRHDPLKCAAYIDLVSSDPPGVAERYGLKADFHPIARRYTRTVSIEAFRPWLYLAGGALAIVALLLWRLGQSRQADRRNSGAASRGVIPALYLAGLLYALVHFNVGIACDFRYLYFPVVASIITMAHIFWAGFATVFTSRGSQRAGV
jgi:hypothetical protein